MKKLCFVLGLLIIGLTGITNYTFSQSLIGIWDKISEPGAPIRYNFVTDSTVLIHFQTRIDTANYTTFPIPSSVLRGIDLGQGGVVGWRGIYDISPDSLVLQIEGYWYTGLPPVPTPTSFNTPTTYNKVTTWIGKNESEILQSFLLLQNYPNPFNPTTSISFGLPSKLFVSLKIFDMLGKEVATIISGELSAGSYTTQWNAANLSSGIYFYHLKAGTFTETKKLVLLR